VIETRSSGVEVLIAILPILSAATGVRDCGLVRAKARSPNLAPGSARGTNARPRFAAAKAAAITPSIGPEYGSQCGDRESIAVWCARRRAAPNLAPASARGTNARPRFAAAKAAAITPGIGPEYGSNRVVGMARHDTYTIDPPAIFAAGIVLNRTIIATLPAPTLLHKTWMSGSYSGRLRGRESGTNSCSPGGARG
jgi:hypothetical protein